MATNAVTLSLLVGGSSFAAALSVTTSSLKRATTTSTCGRSAHPLMQYNNHDNLFGPGDGLDHLHDRWNSPGLGNYGAAFRAQQRALRNAGPYRQHPPPPQLPHHPHHPQQFFDSGPGPTQSDAATSWVLIFDEGRPNEGVYTHTLGGGRPAVLVFECEDDADRFAQSLLGQGFDLARPLAWSADDLTAFTRQAGFEVNRVPRGVQPPPPKNHFLDEPSGDAAMRMRDGRMLRHDPAPSHGDAHTGYRMWLEDLLHLPDDCGDDDCILR